VSTRIHQGSLWQLVGVVLAIACLWSAALILGIYSLFQVLVTDQVMEAGSTSMSAAAFFLAGGLCIPSAYYALCRLFNWQAVDSIKRVHRFQPILLILAFPAVLGLGYIAAQLERLSWILLPPIHVLAIGLPVVWVLYLAIRKLPLGSSQRVWGVFDSGLVLGPGLILVFELAAVIAFIFLGAVVVASKPEMVDRIMSLSEQFSRQTLTQDEALEILGPFLQQPAVILAVLAFAALIVPMIEEVFKPVGAWLLVGRRMTPAEGFAAGALSGAGYALFESLMLSGGGESWMWIVLGRAGTAVLHISTSSLMGWALVQAWAHTRIFRLGLVYLGAVLVHGTWNAVVIVNAYLTLSAEWPTSLVPPSIAGWIGKAAPVILVLIATLMLSTLFWANRRLAASAALRVMEIVPAKNGHDSTAMENELEKSRREVNLQK
jgi:hypothetical protein